MYYVPDYIPLFSEWNRSAFSLNFILNESWRKQRSLSFVKKAVQQARENIELSGATSNHEMLNYLDEEFAKYDIMFQLTFRSDWESEAVGRALIIYVPQRTFSDLTEDEFINEIEDQIILQNEG